MFQEQSRHNKREAVQLLPSVVVQNWNVTLAPTTKLLADVQVMIAVQPDPDAVNAVTAPRLVH